MPIINPADSVVSQNTTWSVGANSGCRVKKHQARENPPRAEPLPSLSSRMPRLPPPSFHKGDICKELKGRFFHAEGSAPPCVAVIIRAG